MEVTHETLDAQFQSLLQTATSRQCRPDFGGKTLQARPFCQLSICAPPFGNHCSQAKARQPKRHHGELHSWPWPVVCVCDPGCAHHSDVYAERGEHCSWLTVPNGNLDQR